MPDSRVEVGSRPRFHPVVSGVEDGPPGAHDSTLKLEGTKAAPPASNPESDFPLLEHEWYRRGPEVARGGLGRIIAAEDERLGRTVALKELISRDPKAEGRFVREAKITARLEHPNIVPIHEAGRWPDGGRFYAMKLVDGKTLSEALAEAQTREARIALLPHLIDVCDAVAYAHTRGILHRDLKPANVMVGQFGETLLIDWGLAKDLSDPDEETTPSPDDWADARSGGETSDGIVVGTPPYMPPEQARAATLDERSDVYALGAMMYQVLSGRRPYEEVSPRDVLLAVVKGPPRPIEELAPDMPRDLVAIVKKAMQRRRAQRYPSAMEMASELRRFSTGQLVAAHRYSPFERFSRFVRLNTAAVAVATTFMVVLCAFAAWSFHGLASRAEDARIARGEAERRVRELTLEKARSLLAKDPTEAMAWLAKVDPPVRGAASVAAEAVDSGVARAVLAEHVQEVDEVEVSPDARTIVSASRDGTVRVWDAEGVLLASLLHGARVSAIDIAPDSNLLATGAYDGKVRIYRLGGRHEDTPTTVIEGHRGAVVAVRFAPTGDRLVSMGRDDALALWTLDGKEALRMRAPDVEDTPQVHFLDEGRHLVTGRHRPQPWLWDLSAGSGAPIEGLPGVATAIDVQRGLLAAGTKAGAVYLVDPLDPRPRLLGVHASEIRAVRLSPNADRLASASMDGEVDLWALEENRVPDVLESHEERVTQLEFSPDGRWLASSSWDGMVRAWELETDETRVLKGHGQVVTDIAFLGDRGLVSSSWDTTLRIWTLAATGERLLRGHRVGVHAVDWSPDGKWIASGGHDDEVRLWELASGASHVFQGHEDHVYRVLFSPDGKWVASSSDDRTVREWSTSKVGSRVLGGFRGDVEELAYSPDGRRLAAASRAGDLFLWRSGADRVPTELRSHDGAVVGVQFVAGGRLMSAGVDGSVLLWSPGREHAPKRLLSKAGALRALHVDSSGKQAAVAGSRGKIWVWDLPEGDLLHELGEFVEPDRVRVSPDRRFVAVASAQRGLWLCNLAYELCDPLVGHDARVFDMEFSPDGRALVTGSGDHSVRLWDVDTLESRVLRGHRAPVFDVSVSPDGGWVASGSGDADVRIWPLLLPPSPEALPELIRSVTTHRALTGR